jgi:hypothetical protein
MCTMDCSHVNTSMSVLNFVDDDFFDIFFDYALILNNVIF